MDATSKGNAFREVLRKMAAGETVSPELWSEFVEAQNDNLNSGPAVGQKIPDFTLPDQDGRQWSVRQLTGPQGLLLAFVRSADW